jgi:lipid II:glycine glycyltransferase (peptidoglycan interpeptide bridge formation enzyme)
VEIRLLSSAEDLAAWDAFVKAGPRGSLWQSKEWKGYQEALGRETRVYGAFQDQRMAACALVVVDRTAGNLATWEIPRGPIGEGREAVARRVVDDARAGKALLVKLSPADPLPLDGFAPSGGHTQPEATRVVSLAPGENDILAQMKPKGRYNIRLAERHDIEVRDAPDVAAFHALMKRTGARDGFGILPASHYEAFLERLPGAFLLLAYHPRTSATEPVAGLLGIAWGGTGIYYYGASDERQRALMAPYLLQWHAMLRCKAAGCLRYDLLGVAPAGAGADHPWAGITGFKEKFGGEAIAYPPETQVILRPLPYALLTLKRRILG